MDITFPISISWQKTAFVGVVTRSSSRSAVNQPSHPSETSTESQD